METSSTVNDDQDALDQRRIEEGDFATLLATYYQPVHTRLLVRLKHQADADDVAQEVMLRLLGELQAGKRYPIPFRVVVVKVTEWTVKAHFVRLRDRAEHPWPSGWDPADKGVGIEERLVGDEWVRWIIDKLPEREREVSIRRYLRGMGIPEIADELDMERNAVDQALWRARKKIEAELST